MNSVGWFEIPVGDMVKAVDFYQHVFQVTLSLNEMGPFQMAWFPHNNEAAGCGGSLVKGEGYIPSHLGTMVYFQVEDINKTLDKIVEKKGKVLHPKMSIGDHGFIAHFEDCEGNRVSIHSRN